MLSVVIPTFNEGGNIRDLVSQVDEALDGIDYEIIFVDDSTDNTPEIIEKNHRRVSGSKINTQRK